MAKKPYKKGGMREPEQKEFEEEILQIDRVTRVVKGGRRLRFRVTMVIGDKKGRVGVGIGKSNEIAAAVKKAVSVAKKSLIKVPITKGDTIPHAVQIKHKAARLLVMPASSGTGVKAGGALRKVLNLAGIKNVLSKSIGSNNRLVTAQASIEALKMLKPVRESDRKTEAKQSVTEEPSKKDADEKAEQKDEKKKKSTEKKAASKPKADKPKKSPKKSSKKD